MVTFVNLTKHEINIEKAIVVPPSGTEARVIYDRKVVDPVALPAPDGNGSDTEIEVYKIGPGAHLVGLPDPEEGKLYLVSAQVRSYLTLLGVERADVLSPYAIIHGGKACSALAR